MPTRSGQPTELLASHKQRRIQRVVPVAHLEMNRADDVFLGEQVHRDGVAYRVDLDGVATLKTVLPQNLLDEAQQVL